LSSELRICLRASEPRNEEGSAPVMPTYDYKCKACGHTFEEFQSMSSEHLTICPSCGKPALVRLMAGGAGLVFKGSGFYLTDYKKTGSSPSSGSSKSDAVASEKKSDMASDAKKSGSSNAGKSPDSGSSSDKSKADSKPTDSSSSSGPSKSDT
jgi:putative FmdB family regulatory protein